MEICMLWNNRFAGDKYFSRRRFVRVKERSVEVPLTFLNPERAMAASYYLKMRRPESLLILSFLNNTVAQLQPH